MNEASNPLDTVLQSIYFNTHSNQQLLALLRLLAQKILQLAAQHQLPQKASNGSISVDYQVFGEWREVQFGTEIQTYSEPVTDQQLADSVADIVLPDDYRRIFYHMLVDDGWLTEPLKKLLQQPQPSQLSTSQQRDIWLWDENSAQTMIIHHRRTKKRLRTIGYLMQSVVKSLRWLLPVQRQYRALLQQAYQSPLTIQGRVGVALHPQYQLSELPLLKQLGDCAVLLRFYAHESEQQWQSTLEYISLLAEQQRSINVALVQDRQAVTTPKHWLKLVSKVIPIIAKSVNWIEIGHAVNRVKWGVWNASEYQTLAATVIDLCQQYPHCRLAAPAIIDFDWPNAINFLCRLPRKSLSVMSNHLYVDRRGAPENFQGKFSTLEKCAMGKAVAMTLLSHSADYVISEFNWPLQGTGIYSPIGSPYTAPEWFRDSPGVTEQHYAYYLIRYLAISLCSGFVSQAILWRLSAHGYGLVDDQDNFRCRPAFYALQTWLSLLDNATFEQQLASELQTYLFQFSKGKQTIILAWHPKEPVALGDLSYDVAYDCFGKPLDAVNVMITQAPIYLIKEPQKN